MKTDDKITSILSRFTDEQLEAELARRDEERAPTATGVSPSANDAEELLSLNDFLVFLSRDVQHFGFLSEERQALTCDHKVPVRMSFSDWMNLWFSEWRDEEEHEVGSAS